MVVVDRAELGRTTLGIGWREPLARFIHKQADLSFVEIMAEYFLTKSRLPTSLQDLRDRGMEIIPHSVSLSLGSAEYPDQEVVNNLLHAIELTGAELVSDHICFTRTGELNSGHLLPIEQSPEMIEVFVQNYKFVQEQLPVPLALENIARIFNWEESSMDEPEFVREIADKTGCKLLLDVSNLYANSINLGWDVDRYLESYPLHALEYVHVAGGSYNHGYFLDTHAHTVGDEQLEVLRKLCERTHPPRVMLERDANYPPEDILRLELDRIQEVIG